MLDLACIANKVTLECDKKYNNVIMYRMIH